MIAHTHTHARTRARTNARSVDVIHFRGVMGAMEGIYLFQMWMDWTLWPFGQVDETSYACSSPWDTNGSFWYQNNSSWYSKRVSRASEQPLLRLLDSGTAPEHPNSFCMLLEQFPRTLQLLPVPEHLLVPEQLLAFIRSSSLDTNSSSWHPEHSFWYPDGSLWFQNSSLTFLALHRTRTAPGTP